MAVAKIFFLCFSDMFNEEPTVDMLVNSLTDDIDNKLTWQQFGCYDITIAMAVASASWLDDKVFSGYKISVGKDISWKWQTHHKYYKSFLTELKQYQGHRLSV